MRKRVQPQEVFSFLAKIWNPFRWIPSRAKKARLWALRKSAMPISRMKAGRFFCRVFVCLLVMAIAMPSGMSGSAYAGKERNSYAGLIADLRVEVADLASEIADLEAEYKEEKERCTELKNSKSTKRSIYTYNEKSDPTYGDDSCECDLFQCSELYPGVDAEDSDIVDDRLDLLGLSKSIFEDDTYEYEQECDGSGKKSTQEEKEHGGGRLVKETKENKENKGKDDPKDGGVACGAKIKVTYVRIKPEEQANVCTAVFEYLEKARSESEFDKRRRNLTTSCIEAARECGPNRKKIDRETCEDTLKELKKEVN